MQEFSASIYASFRREARRPSQNGVSAPYSLLTRKSSGKKLRVQVADIPAVLPQINA
jgi:hypothetical protein